MHGTVLLISGGAFNSNGPLISTLDVLYHTVKAVGVIGTDDISGWQSAGGSNGNSGETQYRSRKVIVGSQEMSYNVTKVTMRMFLAVIEARR